MPFGPREFFDVFRQYNESIWPAQIALAIVAVIAAAAVFARQRNRGTIASLTLSALFAWCGVVYHWMHFSRINPAAWVFGALFVAGALVLFARRSHLEFGTASGPRLAIGALLLFYALIGYPLAARLAGHRYPSVPTFGAPCPVTIFAIALLMTIRPPLPLLPAVVPLIWAAIGSSAAFALGVPEDLGLTAAGLALLVVLIRDGGARGSGLRARGRVGLRPEA